MKAKINGIEMEGTCTEIARIIVLLNGQNPMPKKQTKKEREEYALPEGVNVALVAKSPQGVTKRYSSVDDFCSLTGLNQKQDLIKRILDGQVAFYWYKWYIIPDYTDINKYYEKIRAQAESVKEKTRRPRRYIVKATDTSGNDRIFQSLSQFSVMSKIPLATLYKNRKKQGDRFTVNGFDVVITNKYTPIAK